MIIVDTNVIAYFYIPTQFTRDAERLLEREPVWAAPLLWRSELRNVLTMYVRKELLSFERAFGIESEAESLLARHEYEIDSYDVLKLAAESGCSAYDCEYVSLARKHNARLVTVDRKIIHSFPKTAISLGDAVRN